MGKITAVSSQKGGVGKMMTSINLAADLGYLGNRAFLVDFDPQGDAVQGVGAEVGEDKLFIYNLIMEDYKVEDIWKELISPPIDIVPASIALAGADLQMVKSEVGKEELLKNKLELIKDECDFITIDCPSSLGLLNTNALTAADFIIILVQCEYYALEGVTQLLLTTRLAQQLFNRNLMTEGVVLTMYGVQTKLSVEVQQEVRQYFRDRIHKNYTPRNTKLSGAPSRGMSIFKYDVRCEGVKAHAGLSDEVVKMNKKTKARQGGGWIPKKENSARFGKGLSAIFGEGIGNVPEDIQQGEIEVHEDSKFEVEIKDVEPNPYQPRRNFGDDKIQELADSIKLHGVFIPILVKKAVKGYELIAGERRLRANKVARLKTIPAILMESDDQQMMKIALLENIQREDLNAIEEVQGYEKLTKKLGYIQEELAKRIGKSREYVVNTLWLLKFPKLVQQYVIDKQLSMGHVRALLGLKDVSQIEDVTEKAIQLRLSVRAVETLVKNMNEPKSAPEKEQRDINLDKVQDRLQNCLQTRARIDEKQITIRYDGNKDLNRPLEVLGGIEEE